MYCTVRNYLAIKMSMHLKAMNTFQWHHHCFLKLEKVSRNGNYSDFTPLQHGETRIDKLSSLLFHRDHKHWASKPENVMHRKRYHLRKYQQSGLTNLCCNTIFLHKWFLGQMNLKWIIGWKRNIKASLEEHGKRVTMVAHKQGIVAQRRHGHPNLEHNDNKDVDLSRGEAKT